MAASNRAWAAAHIVGWLTLGLARAAALRPLVEAQQWSRLAPMKVAGAFFGLAISSVLVLWYRRSFEPRFSKLPFLVGPLIGMTVWSLLATFPLRSAMGVAQPDDWLRLPFSLVSTGLLLYGWTGIYLAVRFADQMERKKTEALRAESVAHKAQLLALHYQLNPHFLFNALTAIRNLATTAPEDCRNTIGRLASFLRYALDTDPEQLVLLSEELESVRNFAEIESARYAEQVDFSFQIDPTTLRAQVPPLFMLPIVENATKHGELGPDGVLRVTVRTQQTTAGIRITVTNTGTLEHNFKAQTRPGLGLPNVDARMSAAFANRYHRKIFEQTGTVVNELLIEAP